MDVEYTWIDQESAPKLAIGTQTGADRKFVLGPDRWSANNESVIVDHRYTVPIRYAPLWASGGTMRPFAIGPLEERVILPDLENASVDEFIQDRGGVPRAIDKGTLPHYGDRRWSSGAYLMNQPQWPMNMASG